MDTDDLSEEAYEAIILQSERFHHDVTLQFGVLSSSCKDESEYLENSLLLIEDIESDFEYAIATIFFEKAPTIEKFKIFLNKLKESINEVRKIPINKRTYIGW